jgi:hypothetical protein
MNLHKIFEHFKVRKFNTTKREYNGASWEMGEESQDLPISSDLYRHLYSGTIQAEFWARPGLEEVGIQAAKETIFRMLYDPVLMEVSKLEHALTSGEKEKAYKILHTLRRALFYAEPKTVKSERLYTVRFLDYMSDGRAQCEDFEDLWLATAFIDSLLADPNKEYGGLIVK